MDALNLGPKLQSVLDYHFLPAAYSGSQLVAARTLDTDLGVSVGAPYNLSFAQAAGGPVGFPFLCCSPIRLLWGLPPPGTAPCCAGSWQPV